MPPSSIGRKELNKSTVGQRKLLYKHSHKVLETKKLKLSTKGVKFQSKREKSLDQQKANEVSLDQDYVCRRIHKKSSNQISWDNKIPSDQTNIVVEKVVKGKELPFNDFHTALLCSNFKTRKLSLSPTTLSSSFGFVELNKNANINISVVPKSINLVQAFNKSNVQQSSNESGEETQETSGVTKTSETTSSETNNDTTGLSTTTNDLEKKSKGESSETEISTNPTKKESDRTTVSSVSRPDQSTGCNRLLHSPVHLDNDGLPIPVTRPGLIPVPSSKQKSQSSLLCCCCKPSIRGLTKKIEQYEAKLGQDLQEETKTVLKDINKYRKSMRTALAEVSDTLFNFDKKLSQKWKSKSPVDFVMVNHFSDFMQKIINKLKVDVDWLERLANDLRSAESKPLTILGILHHLFHNEAILSLESKSLVRKFAGETKNLQFHSQMEKLAVQVSQSTCNGTGTIRLKKERSIETETSTPPNDNTNNNNDTNNPISDNFPSDESETLDMIVEYLLSILQNPTLLNRALRKIAEVPEISNLYNQAKRSNLGRGDESLQSSEKTKTLFTAPTVLSNKVVSHAKQTSSSFTKLQNGSRWLKSTKRNSQSSLLLTEKKKSQRSSAFHSCFDKTSFYTTLFDIDSIPNEGSQFQSISKKASDTLVNDTGAMFTADDFVESNNRLRENWIDHSKKDKLQKINKTDQNASLKPKLIEVIHKVNELARANNRAVKRIKALERFVGKKSSKRKRKPRK